MTIEEIEESRRILARDNVHHPLWSKAFRERTRALLALLDISEQTTDPKSKYQAEMAMADACRTGDVVIPQDTMLTPNEVQSLLRLEHELSKAEPDVVGYVPTNLLRRLLADWRVAANIHPKQFKPEEVAP